MKTSNSQRTPSRGKFTGTPNPLALLRAALLSIAAGTPAMAQCPETWLPAGTAAAGQGASGTILQMLELGNGDVLVGGSFNRIGGITANNIALYRPGTNTWSTLGSGVSGPVYAMARVPNTGSGGTDYIVGGAFSSAGGNSAGNIARYNPSTNEWTAIGSGVSGGTTPVNAMTNLPNGDIIVGGSFTSAGGISANRIVRLNANNSPPQWVPLGSGVSSSGPTECVVYETTVLTGGDFIVGGIFDSAGGQPANFVARYSTATNSWSALSGGGTNNSVFFVRALFPTTDVLMGGAFTTAGGVTANRVVRYNTATGAWTPLGSGVNNSVLGLTALPGGDYIVGGDFTSAGGIAASRIARFSPATGAWSALEQLGTNGRVRAIVAQAQNNSDGRLILGGNFTTVTPAAAISERFARVTLGAAAPAVATQPQPASVCAGGTATFTVTISSNQIPAYQWRRGTTVVGTNSPTLTITNASAANIGDYTCTLTNSCGSTTTVPATLTVSTPVSITSQPTLPPACQASPVSLSVIASGTGPLTYRWRKGGANISTATNPSAATSTLVLPSMSAGDIGSYDCVVTGPCGSLASSAVNIAALLTPVAITVDPASQTACRGTTATLTVTASGTGPLAYQWRKNGTPISTVTNSSAATATLSLPGAQPTDDGSYDCVVTNPCRSVTSAAAALTVNQLTVAITSQPVDTVGCAGGTVQLSVSGTGFGTVQYRWRRNGFEIPLISNTSAVTATLQLTGAPSEISGQYDCLVYDTCTTVISRAATVVVRGPRWVPYPSAGYGGNGVPGIVAALTVLPSGQVLLGGDFGAGSGTTPSNIASIQGGTITPSAPMPYPVNAMALGAGGIPFAAGANGSSGFVAKLEGGWNTIATTTRPVMSLAAAPNGDIIAAGSFSASTGFGGVATRVMRYSAAAWTGMGLPIIPDIRAVTVMPIGTVVVAGFGTATDFSDRISSQTTFSSIWNPSYGIGAGTFQGDASALITTPSGGYIVGGRYTYQPPFGGGPSVRGLYAPGDSNRTLNSTCDGRVLALAYLPDGRLVAGGIFNSIGGVAARNIAVWNGSNWQPLGSGINGSVRALAVTSGGELVAGGQFPTAGGEAATNIARFVFDTVSISVQPSPALTCPGEVAEFRVTVTESNPTTLPLRYQWRKNGVDIDPAINSTAATYDLFLPVVTPDDVGSYDCIISSGCTTLTSAAVPLLLSGCGPTACSLADIAGGGDTGLAPDGILDGTDFIAFINSFSIGDPAVDALADVAGGGANGLQPDGTIDGTDFIEFINAFAVGC